MNPFALTITRVRAELPVSGVLDASELDAYIDTAAVYVRARSRAAEVLRTARKKMAQTRRDAALLREATLAKAEAEVRETVARAHDAVMRDVVTWLVDEADLERQAAARVEAQCRDWVAGCVAAFAGEADRSALIATRISSHLRELASHGRFTVRLAEADVAAVSERLPDEPGMELLADPALVSGKAWLDSPFVRLELDLNRQLDQLLAAIRGYPGPDVIPLLESGHSTDILADSTSTHVGADHVVSGLADDRSSSFEDTGR